MDTYGNEEFYRRGAIGVEEALHGVKATRKTYKVEATPAVSGYTDDYRRKVDNIEHNLVELEKAYVDIVDWINQLEEELSFRGIDIDENFAKLFNGWSEQTKKELDMNGNRE